MIFGDLDALREDVLGRGSDADIRASVERSGESVAADRAERTEFVVGR
jgi:hypothetical protein